MAQVIFRRNREEKTLTPSLVIGYMTLEEEDLELEMEFGCGEDLQAFMTAVLKKDFGFFFSESSRISKDVTDMWIKGISVVGNTDEGRLVVHVIDNYVQGSSIINEEVLQDKNAEKMANIAKIINS